MYMMKTLKSFETDITHYWSKQIETLNLFTKSTQSHEIDFCYGDTGTEKKRIKETIHIK